MGIPAAYLAKDNAAEAIVSSCHKLSPQTIELTQDHCLQSISIKHFSVFLTLRAWCKIIHGMANALVFSELSY